MAADLAETPATGLRVQACGDCHLLQLRRVRHARTAASIFDINDLDETLPAPWEWDVKRLAASFVLACRNNGFSEDDARAMRCWRCVRSYRERMAEYSEMPVLDVWYAEHRCRGAHRDGRRTRKPASASRSGWPRPRERSVLEHDFPKLATIAGRVPHHQGQPAADLPPAGQGGERTGTRVQEALCRLSGIACRKTGACSSTVMQLMDMAIKVVGVGSVGTFCGITLLMAEREGPPVPPGQASARLGAGSLCRQERPRQPRPAGRERIPAHAIGQRHLPGLDDGHSGRHFYVRQLRDMKIRALVELFTPSSWSSTPSVAAGRWRAPTPAPASRPRSAATSARATCSTRPSPKFASAYADQSERDHAVLKKAVRSGQVEVVMETDR